MSGRYGWHADAIFGLSGNMMTLSGGSQMSDESGQTYR